MALTSNNDLYMPAYIAMSTFFVIATVVITNKSG